MADYIPIPLQAQAPDPMKSLSSLLGTAQGIQNYNLGKDTYDAKVLNENSTASSAQSKATVDQANIQPNIDERAAQASTAQTGAQAAKFGLQKGYATAAQETAQGLLADPSVNATGTNYDPQKVTQAILNAKNQMRAKGVPDDQAELAAAPLYMQVHTPGAVAQTLKNSVLGNMGSANQASAITPGGIDVSNGAGSATVNNRPLAGAIGSVVPGTATVAQPGPTTGIIGPDGRTPGILGAQPGAAPGAGVQAAPPQARSMGNAGVVGHYAVDGEPVGPSVPAKGSYALGVNGQVDVDRAQQAINSIPPGPARDMASKALAQQIAGSPAAGAVPQAPPPQQAQGGAPASGFIPTGRPVGATEANANNISVAQNHFAGLAADTANAAKLEGIAQNIKAYAPKAIAGTESDKLGFFNGILSQLGNDKASDLKQATDLLQKNMAQLTVNSKAGSDAQQTLLQLAQPHSTMDPKAIGEAADQIIGQVRANKAAFGQFLPEVNHIAQSGDPSAYLSKMKSWNDVADPRVWQYESLAPADRKAFMANLPAGDRANLIKNAGTLSDQYGLFK